MPAAFGFSASKRERPIGISIADSRMLPSRSITLEVLAMAEIEPMIHWRSSLDEALEQAAREGKRVLLDFFVPT